MDKTHEDFENDDISLAEIVYIFIKRKRVFLCTFLVLSALSVGFAFFAEDRNDAHVSIYQVSEVGSKNVISKGEITDLLKENFYYERIMNDPHLISLWNKTTFPLSHSPNLLKIETYDTKKENVLEFHKLLFEYISKYVTATYETARIQLEMELENSTIKSKRSDAIKKSLVSGVKGKMLFLAESKNKLEGSGLVRKVIIAFIFSVFFSLVIVFAIEISSRLRQELKEIKARSAKA